MKLIDMLAMCCAYLVVLLLSKYVIESYFVTGFEVGIFCGMLMVVIYRLLAYGVER